MRNSYEVICNKLSLDNFRDATTSYFIHNPNEEVTEDVLRDMYNYFKSKREWDKVVKIMTLLAKIKFYDTIKGLSKTHS